MILEMLLSDIMKWEHACQCFCEADEPKERRSPNRCVHVPTMESAGAPLMGLLCATAIRRSPLLEISHRHMNFE